jgi:hypothetical protein
MTDDSARADDVDLDPADDVDLDPADDAETVEEAEAFVEEAAAATGDYRVDVALSRLAELRGLPVVEHVAVYEDVHAQIQTALADLDER